MLKPLTFGLGLAVAFGLSTVAFAQMPSSQGLPTGQGVTPSLQGLPGGACDTCGGECAPAAPAKKCRLFDLFKHQPRTYTYEWVLQKKLVHKPFFSHGHQGLNPCATCGDVTCDVCGAPMAGGILPSAQGMPTPQIQPMPAPAPKSLPAPQAMPAPQAAPTPQFGPAPQAVAAPQMTGSGQAEAPAATTAPAAAAPAPAPEEPPAMPATEEKPEEPKQADAGGLLLLNPAR